MTEYFISAGNRPYFKLVNGEDGPEERSFDQFIIAAGTSEGRNYERMDYFATEAEAVAAAALVEAYGDTPAANPDVWFEGEPSYGSDAWDSEAEYNLACFEADCYGEPRPNWF